MAIRDDWKVQQGDIYYARISEQDGNSIQAGKRSIDLWIVAASVKWMLLFIKDGEKVIR